PYTVLRPHLGVLAGRADRLESLHPDSLAPATDDVPERFEFGTLPYELLAGTSAAVDLLTGLDPGAAGTRRERLAASFGALAAHEDQLRSEIEAGLATISSIRMYSRAARRTPTLLLTIDGRDPVDAYTFLAERGIAAPAGTFYAQEPSRHLGLGDTGGLRIGLAPYNDRTDVERLLTALDDFIIN
ncbi:MAG: aminotransferase class V-fold PLP-dependent enzyme, partial [Acidimicrobiales bacterium]